MVCPYTTVGGTRRQRRGVRVRKGTRQRRGTRQRGGARKRRSYAKRTKHRHSSTKRKRRHRRGRKRGGGCGCTGQTGGGALGNALVPAALGALLGYFSKTRKKRSSKKRR